MQHPVQHPPVHHDLIGMLRNPPQYQRAFIEKLQGYIAEVFQRDGLFTKLGKHFRSQLRCGMDMGYDHDILIGGGVIVGITLDQFRQPQGLGIQRPPPLHPQLQHMGVCPDEFVRIHRGNGKIITDSQHCQNRQHQQKQPASQLPHPSAPEQRHRFPPKHSKGNPPPCPDTGIFAAGKQWNILLLLHGLQGHGGSLPLRQNRCFGKGGTGDRPAVIQLDHDAVLQCHHRKVHRFRVFRRQQPQRDSLSTEPLLFVIPGIEGIAPGKLHAGAGPVGGIRADHAAVQLDDPVGKKVRDALLMGDHHHQRVF